MPCSWRPFHSSGAVQKEAWGSCLCAKQEDNSFFFLHCVKKVPEKKPSILYFTFIYISGHVCIKQILNNVLIKQLLFFGAVASVSQLPKWEVGTPCLQKWRRRTERGAMSNPLAPQRSGLKGDKSGTQSACSQNSVSCWRPPSIPINSRIRVANSVQALERMCGQ